MDSTELLEQGGTPFDDFVIIGGGVIGVEFATVYNGFGSHVTVVEALDRLIPTVDQGTSPQSEDEPAEGRH